MAMNKAFFSIRKRLPDDKNSCINCDDYLTRPLAVSNGSWAWTWFHTGFVNNFISKDPETNLLHLNW